MSKYFFLLLFCSLRVLGQNSDIYFQNWFDFNASHIITQDWKLYGDAGYRIVYNSDNISRLYVRPAASFRINNVATLNNGVAVFATFNSKNILWEFRIFQGVLIKWPTVLSIKLNNYFRIEERFFTGNNANTFILRLRYRLSTDIPLNQVCYIPLELEWFVNYGTDIDFQLNETRSTVGLGYTIDDFWKIEFISIFQNLNASNDLFSINSIIFRFRIFKDFN